MSSKNLTSDQILTPHLHEHSYKNFWIIKLKVFLFHDAVIQKTSCRYLENMPLPSEYILSGIYWACSWIWITMFLTPWSQFFEFVYPLWNIYTFNPFFFEIHILHEKEFCNLLYDLLTSTILILVDLFNGVKSFLSLRWEVPYLLQSLSLFNIPSLILFFFKVRKPWYKVM